MKDSKYKLLISNTLLFAIGNLIVKLISFFLMPLYTTVLTTEQYGIAELLNNAIEIIMPIASLCIVDALYRFSIDKNTDHTILFTNSLLIIVLGDVCVFLGCFVWRFIIGYKYAFYFFLLYFTATLYRLTTQFARGLNHVKKFVFYGIVNASLLIFANYILLVVFKGGISAYLLSFSIGYGIAGIIAFILSNEYQYLKFKYYNLSWLKEMLQYSLPGIPNMLSWWINSLSGRYVILFYWGAEITGLYAAASKLPAMINIATSIFQQAWQYSTATEIDSIDNKTFFSNVFRVYTYICISFCSIIIVINKPICSILLKSDFYISWKYVPVLLLAATFGCISTYFGTFYNAIKNNKMLMLSTMCGAAVNIILNFLLIPEFRALGASISMAISYFFIMIIRIFDVRKFIDLNINAKLIMLQFSILLISVYAGCLECNLSFFLPVLCTIMILLSDYQLILYGLNFIKRRLNYK